MANDESRVEDDKYISVGIQKSSNGENCKDNIPRVCRPIYKSCRDASEIREANHHSEPDTPFETSTQIISDPGSNERDC